MAGGIQRPLTLNPKCVVFSLICMLLYLADPKPLQKYNVYILAGIFVIAYVAMAWYDAFFDCRTEPFERGTRSVTGLVKPEAHVESQTIPSPCHKHNLIIYLMHIVIIVPLLGYAAWKAKETQQQVYTLLGATAVFTLGYHVIQLTTDFDK